MITGRGEPTLQYTDLHVILEQLGPEFPRVEIQTNGTQLLDPVLLGFRELGVTCVSISASSMDPETNCSIMGHDHDYYEVASRIVKAGMLCRISLNMTGDDFKLGEGPKNKERFEGYVSALSRLGIQQLTCRRLGIPHESKDDRAKDWVQEHGADYHDSVGMLEYLLRDGGYARYKLEHGDIVYAYKGLSVSMATCMALEVEPSEELRSLVLQPDGFIHVGWEGCPLL